MAIETTLKEDLDPGSPNSQKPPGCLAPQIADGHVEADGFQARETGKAARDVEDASITPSRHAR